MNEQYEKLKKLYTNVYKLTLEIGSLIEERKFDLGLEVLDTRKNLLEEAEILCKSCNFSETETLELKTLINNFKNIDNQNISKLEDGKNIVQGKLKQISKKQKIINVYKIQKKEIKPIMFDSKE